MMKASELLLQSAEPFDKACMLVRDMELEIDQLRSAIQQTLDENRHLADGDDCTLIHLVRVLEATKAKDISLPTNKASFYGAIVDVSKEVVRQKVGRDPDVTKDHLVSMLSRVPRKGEVVEIQYKNGVGMVSEEPLEIGIDR